MMAAPITRLQGESAALAMALIKVECTSEQVHTLSLLDRLLAGSIAGVENPTDAHWVMVRKMIEAHEARE